MYDIILIGNLYFVDIFVKINLLYIRCLILEIDLNFLFLFILFKERLFII